MSTKTITITEEDHTEIDEALRARILHLDDEAKEATEMDFDAIREHIVHLERIIEKL